jgi:hypothetical protein
MSEEQKLLELFDLVRSRLERDLKALSDISQETKLPLADLLSEVHSLYERYNEQLIMLNMASKVANDKSSQTSSSNAIMRQLRSIDQ